MSGVLQIKEKDEALHIKMGKKREQKRNLSQASVMRSYSTSFGTRKLEAKLITRKHYALANVAAIKSVMAGEGEGAQ